MMRERKGMLSLATGPFIGFAIFLNSYIICVFLHYHIFWCFFFLLNFTLGMNLSSFSSILYQNRIPTYSSYGLFGLGGEERDDVE